MRISIVVAMDRNNLIGSRNGLPWRLPADLKHFKSVTMGKPIVMGRKTHDSIGRALPGRRNIVISRDPDYSPADGCVTVRTLEAALESGRGAEEVMVVGGASIYQQALPLASRIYLTRIDAEFQGDTWFPSFDAVDWQEVSRMDHGADADNPYPYSFIEFEKADPGFAG